MASVSPMNLEKRPTRAAASLSQNQARAEACSVRGSSERDSNCGVGKMSGDEGSTSRSLLAALKADDSHAWDRLVALYTPLVYHWCKGHALHDQDIPDVLQEVFQAVAGNIERFHKDRPRDTFRGWLRTITRSKVYDHYRRQQRQPRAPGGSEANVRFAQVPDELPSGDASQEQHAHQLVLRGALEHVRKDFTERTWQAFWRVVVDGQAAADVADELSMRPGAVRVAKCRVLRRLRQALGDIG